MVPDTQMAVPSNGALFKVSKTMTKFTFKSPNSTLKMRLMSESNVRLMSISNLGQMHCGWKWKSGWPQKPTSVGFWRQPNFHFQPKSNDCPELDVDINLTSGFDVNLTFIYNQNATHATKIIPWLTLLLSIQGPWRNCSGVKSTTFVKVS